MATTQRKEEPKYIAARFEIGQLLPLGLTLVITVIGIAIGLDVASDLQSDYVTNTAGCNATDTSACGGAYNASADGMGGIGKITGKLPIIGTAVAFAVILGILVRYLMVRMG